jgi:dsRNA-specific ribonuclease
MKNLTHQKDTTSYMQMCLQMEGKAHPVYLMVPTHWDSVKKQWMAHVKTPQSHKIIHVHGNTDQELQDNFNIEFCKLFESNLEEALSMFKALEYWESRI